MAAKATALAAGDGSADSASPEGSWAAGRDTAGDATAAGGAWHPDRKLARMRVLVVVPTYNEASGIETVLRRIREELPHGHVLVVDDNSPDGTAALVDAVSSSDDHVTLLRRATKAGLGSAYLTGFAAGLDRGFDVLVEMDADLSHDPAALPALVSATMHGADVAIGSRYVLRRLDLDHVRAYGYGFQVEMTYRLVRQGGRVVEIPVAFVDRQAGESKMSLPIVLEAFALVTGWGVRDVLTGRRRRTPPATGVSGSP